MPWCLVVTDRWHEHYGLDRLTDVERLETSQKLSKYSVILPTTFHRHHPMVASRNAMMPCGDWSLTWTLWSRSFDRRWTSWNKSKALEIFVDLANDVPSTSSYGCFKKCNDALWSMVVDMNAVISIVWHTLNVMDQVQSSQNNRWSCQRGSIDIMLCLLQLCHAALWSMVIDMNAVISIVWHTRNIMDQVQSSQIIVGLANDVPSTSCYGCFKKCNDALWSMVVDMNAVISIVWHTLNVMDQVQSSQNNRWSCQRGSIDIMLCLLQLCHAALWSMVIDMNAVISIVWHTRNIMDQVQKSHNNRWSCQRRSIDIMLCLLQKCHDAWWWLIADMNTMV